MGQVGQRALITGASSGIGAALARKLAARGFEVWLASRRTEMLQSVAAEIESARGRAHVVALDVADGDATARLVSELDHACGGFDLVIANAGYGKADPAATMTWPVTRDTLLTNLVGVAATVTPLVPRMIARNRGHIVGISSLAADLPAPGAASYGASKAGLTFFLSALRPELEASGVAVTIIEPGYIHTAMTAGTEKLPFVLPLDRAVEIIDRAIERRVRLLRFPRLPAFLIRIASLLPSRLLNPLLMRMVK